jgi:hypothetical protein
MGFESLTPRISKHYLLFIAALVWTFAGGMLEYRGYSYLVAYPHFLVIRIVACILGGTLFFNLLFSKISGKHVARILNLSIERPCVFSFFNWRSYLMMGIMISSGVMLRKTGVISPEYLSLIYITMGIPLLMSSFRFYNSFFKRI